MKKILLVAKRGVPHVSSLINIAREEKAGDYKLRFFIDDYWDVLPPVRKMLKNLGYFLYEGTYTSFRESLSALIEILDTYQPDIVINDSSLAAGMALKIRNVPMAYSILRAGEMPGVVTCQEQKKYWETLMQKELALVLEEYPAIRITDPRELLITDRILIPSLPFLDSVPGDILPECEKIYIGPQLVDLGGVSEETQEWLKAAKQSGQPMILVSFGLSFTGRELLESFLEQANTARFRVLATFHDPAQLQGEYDKEKVHVVPLIPISNTAPHFDLMLHHGGTQTTLAALGSGTPTVTISVSNPEWSSNARAVEALGTGLHVRFTTIPSIYNAIESVLGCPFHSMAAKHLASAVSQSAVHNVLEMIEKGFSRSGKEQ